VQEESKAYREEESKLVKNQTENRDEAKRLRDIRKAEALRKSKERQSDPDYFRKRVEANKIKDEKISRNESLQSGEQTNDDEIVETTELEQDDPFRPSYAKKSTKVYVK